MVDWGGRPAPLSYNTSPSLHPEMCLVLPSSLLLLLFFYQNSNFFWNCESSIFEYSLGFKTCFYLNIEHKWTRCESQSTLFHVHWIITKPKEKSSVRLRNIHLHTNRDRPFKFYSKIKQSKKVIKTHSFFIKLCKNIYKMRQQNLLSSDADT